MKGLAKGLEEQRRARGWGPWAWGEGQELQAAPGGTALGVGGRMELEDGSLLPSGLWSHDACLWHFPPFQLQEGLLTTGQSQERSPESLPSNLAPLAL